MRGSQKQTADMSSARKEKKGNEVTETPLPKQMPGVLLLKQEALQMDSDWMVHVFSIEYPPAHPTEPRTLVRTQELSAAHPRNEK